jgi:GTP-binding protein
MAEMDPVKAFEIIEGELGAFSERLLEKPMIVVATKLDATTDRTKLEELRKFCKKKGLEFHAISAAAGEGVKELVRGIADALDKIPKEIVDDEDTEVEKVEEVNELKDSEAATIVDDLENED